MCAELCAQSNSLPTRNETTVLTNQPTARPVTQQSTGATSLNVHFVGGMQARMAPKRNNKQIHMRGQTATKFMSI